MFPREEAKKFREAFKANDFLGMFVSGIVIAKYLFGELSAAGFFAPESLGTLKSTALLSDDEAIAYLDAMSGDTQAVLDKAVLAQLLTFLFQKFLERLAK